MRRRGGGCSRTRQCQHSSGRGRQRECAGLTRSGGLGHSAVDGLALVGGPCINQQQDKPRYPSMQMADCIRYVVDLPRGSVGGIERYNCVALGTAFGLCFLFFSSRRRHTRWTGDWSSDVCSSDLALAAWLRLLLPGGTLVLIEGRWSTGAGLTTADAGRAVLRQRVDATVTGLDDPVLWGGPISDERYLMVSRA